MKTYKLTLSKPAQRQLQDKTIEANIRNLLSSVNSRSLHAAGWELVVADRHFRQRYIHTSDSSYVYEMYLIINYLSSDKTPDRNRLNSLLRTIATRATQPNFGRWTLSEVDDKPYVAPDEKGIIDLDLGYAELTIPRDWRSHFGHLYGLDDHIERVRSALEVGIDSHWVMRPHSALIGPPGCGKSDICQSIKRALGEDTVLEFDATATTSAGAIQTLAEREILPRVLIVEEIEKADEKTMSFLLSVLDLRGQIRKTTARSTIERDMKLYCIATVNDHELFKKLQAGALSSRFSNVVGFQRPGRKVLQAILERDLKNLDGGGDPAWIGPTLDYCDSQHISDPRMASALCVMGRDKWMNGRFAKILTNTDVGNAFDE